MRCEEALEWIQRELDGDLTSEEKLLLRRHLSTCSGCAAEAERLKRLSDGLSRLPRVTPPHSVVDRLIESGQLPGGGASRQREGIKRRRFGWWFGGGAAAAVLVFVFVGLWKGWYGAPEQPVDNRTLMMNSEKREDSVSPSGNMTMSAPESESRTSSAWSPDGRFRAEVEKNQVVIRTADGKEWFRSKPWKEGKESSVQWISPTSLQVEIAPPEEGEEMETEEKETEEKAEEENREVRIIDVEAKRELEKDRSRGDGG